MKWGDVNYDYNLQRARVWAPSTPDAPETGDPGAIGTVICPFEGALPILRVGNTFRYFAHWYDVQFLDEVGREVRGPRKRYVV